LTTTSISWRRLGTEGLVIVVSILLAFAIDAGWSGHQEARRVDEYVVALKGEFDEARVEMAEQLADRSYQLAAVDSLLSAVRTGQRSDQLWAWIEQLRAIYVFGPSQPAYEALANSSGLELLISPSLRLALLRYGQAKDFLGVLSQRELRAWEDLEAPYLLENTDATLFMGPPLSPEAGRSFESGVDLLYSDRYFQNLLARRHDRISILRDMDRDVLAAIDAVLAAIAGR
jgi:hypothetical protein